MPRNKPLVSELGTIYVRGAEFCAHIQFRDDGGNNKHIYGQSRASQPAASQPTILNIGACQHTTLETQFSWFFVVCVVFYGHFPVELYA